MLSDGFKFSDLLSMILSRNINIRKILVKPKSSQETSGTFAVPRYYIPEGSQNYDEAQKLFKKIKWKR